MPSGDGGLGSALIGEKIMINHLQVAVTKLLGEGGFSYVYQVKEISDTSAGQSLNNTVHGDGTTADVTTNSGGKASNNNNNNNNNNNKSSRQGSMGSNGEKKDLVLKVTSILSRQQRDIAEKEAKLLSRLSHPSIIKMYDTCYRTVSSSSGGGHGFRSNKDDSKNKDRPQHLILLEFCEGGHSLDVCNALVEKRERFDLSTLIIAFGQICNAVSYLHAQRPPIVHRDLKPANFLVKNGAYKLCDFGSAVFGHVDLKTPAARNDAEEVIQKTTTQMFRSPEMVDLYMAKKLTQATDVWALGACLYSLAFLQNCFEEGSNLAILSNKYKIPEDNPYGDGLVELIDRMLTIDTKSRADMTEVILCLSAVYSGRPLPPRKERSKKDKKDKDSKDKDKSKKKKDERTGTFRTDGQGITDDGGLDPAEAMAKKTEAKKLNPNSAAARRRQQAGGNMAADKDFASFHSRFDEVAAQETSGTVNQEMAFSTTANPFASAESGSADASDGIFNFEEPGNASSQDVLDAFGQDQDWTTMDLAKEKNGENCEKKKENDGPSKTEIKRQRSRSIGRRASARDDKPRRRVPSRGASLRKDGAKSMGDAVAKANEAEKRRQRSSSTGRGLKKTHSKRQLKKQELAGSMDDMNLDDDDDDDGEEADDDARIAAAVDASEDDDGGEAARSAARRRPSGKARSRPTRRDGGVRRPSGVRKEPSEEAP